MRRAWTRIAVVAVISAAVAFWVYYDKQRLQNTPEHRLDTVLNAMPSWQVLKEQDPRFVARIREQILTMHKAGESEQEIIDVVQPQILELQMSRLQYAPDANAVAWMTINMEQTAAIQKVSDDACFRFLFPAVKGGVNPMRVLDKTMMQRRMQADAEMMRAGWGENRHTVSPEEHAGAVEDVRPIMQDLTVQYGKDIQLLAMPENAVGKEKLTCELVQAMWAKVLALPEKKAARVIRMAVTEQD